MRVGAVSGRIRVAISRPRVENALSVREASGDVLAPGVVRIAEGGHPGVGIASEAVRMAESVMNGHVVAHPSRGVLKRDGNLERSSAVLCAVVVYQLEESPLFAVEDGGGRGRRGRRLGKACVFRLKSPVSHSFRLDAGHPGGRRGPVEHCRPAGRILPDHGNYVAGIGVHRSQHLAGGRGAQYPCARAGIALTWLIGVPAGN